MTVRTTINCDGYGCFNEIDVEHYEDVDSTLNNSNWVDDEENWDTHYCPKCAAKISHE